MHGYGFATISVMNDTITLCSNHQHMIAILNFTGEILQQINHYKAKGVHKFSHPQICQSNSKGSHLIADQGSKRLLLVEEGSWSIVDIDLKELRPKGAVYVNETLYVHGKELFKGKTVQICSKVDSHAYLSKLTYRKGYTWDKYYKPV